MDEVFGNSSGETVVESPLSCSLVSNDQDLNSSDVQIHLHIHPDGLDDSDEVSSSRPDNKSKLCHESVFDTEFTADQDAGEFGMKKKNATNLNVTENLQIIQNSENHQLEQIQKLNEFDVKDHIRLSKNSLEEFCITENKYCETYNSVEEYLNGIIKVDVNQYNQNNSNLSVNNIDREKHMNTVNLRYQQTYKSVPNYQKHTRNTIYQLPPTHLHVYSAFKMKSPNPLPKLPYRSVAYTTASLTAKHLYQNLPVPLSYRHSPLVRSQCAPSPQTLHAVGSLETPTYVNVPLPRSHPRGVTLDTAARTKHSYIQLWSGGQHESLSDTECDDVKKHCTNLGKKSMKALNKSMSPRVVQSSPGYVQMASPFVKSPVSSVYAQLANSLASYAGHAPQTIFCPLCPRQFSYDRTLSSHIQRTHRFELESMIDGKPGDLSLQCCPICQARFFNSSVLPKHLTDCHKDCVIQLLEKHRCIVTNTNGMQCPFCSKCVPVSVNGEHIMIFHLHQYHLTQYEDMINTTFKVYSGKTNKKILSGTSTVDFQDIFGFDPGATSTPGLSGKMGTLAVTSDSKRKLHDMEKDELPCSTFQDRKGLLCFHECKGSKTPKNYEKQEPRRSLSKGILRRDKSSSDRPNVKRELRFSVPHVTKEQVYFPESPGPVTPDYQERVDLKAFSYPEPQQPANAVAQSDCDMDAITTEDFIDDSQQGSRKRRRIGLSIRSRKIFKCRDKENQEDKTDDLENQVYATASTRTFRRPKPVATPRVPNSKLTSNGSPCASKLHSTTMSTSTNSNNQQVQPVTESLNGISRDFKNSNKLPVTVEVPFVQQNVLNSDSYPFSALKLYSPLRLFRCNGCRQKFCDNDSLLLHITQQHRGLLSMLRPQFGCGVCSAKFYENKYLVKHCLQHHTSLLEIRSSSGEQAPVVETSSPMLKCKGKQGQVTAL